MKRAGAVFRTNEMRCSSWNGTVKRFVRSVVDAKILCDRKRKMGLFCDREICSCIESRSF